MKLLLDTATFLFAIEDEGKVSAEARRYIDDPDEDIYLSAVSAWEIAIKHGLGKLELPGPPADVVPVLMTKTDVRALPIQVSHALQVAQLPPHQRSGSPLGPSVEHWKQERSPCNRA